jgi:hypothetical protein
VPWRIEENDLIIANVEDAANLLAGRVRLGARDGKLLAD